MLTDDMAILRIHHLILTANERTGISLSSRGRFHLPRIIHTGYDSVIPRLPALLTLGSLKVGWHQNIIVRSTVRALWLRRRAFYTRSSRPQPDRIHSRSSTP